MITLLHGAMEFTSVQCSVQVKQLQNPEMVFETIIGLVVRLAEHGLIHCDFNEFNIMVSISGSLILHHCNFLIALCFIILSLCFPLLSLGTVFLYDCFNISINICASNAL